MGLLNILLLLTASLACASANIKSYGEIIPNVSQLLAVSIGHQVQDRAKVTFNIDKKYNLTIHLVMVSFLLESVHSELVNGGPNTNYFTLELSAMNAVNPWVEIFIYGVMNEQIEGYIKHENIEFT